MLESLNSHCRKTARVLLTPDFGEKDPGNLRMKMRRAR